jgi:hypothetical protein
MVPAAPGVCPSEDVSCARKGNISLRTESRQGFLRNLVVLHASLIAHLRICNSGQIDYCLTFSKTAPTLNVGLALLKKQSKTDLVDLLTTDCRHVQKFASRLELKSRREGDRGREESEEIGE